MAWPIQLSPGQSQHLYGVLVQYRDYIKGEKPEVYAMVAIVVSMMERGIALDIPEMRLVQGVLDEWLSMLSEDEWDENLEKAYYKLYGAWPLDPPYFVKRDKLPWPM